MWKDTISKAKRCALTRWSNSIITQQPKTRPYMMWLSPMTILSSRATFWTILRNKTKFVMEQSSSRGVSHVARVRSVRLHASSARVNRRSPMSYASRACNRILAVTARRYWRSSRMPSKAIRWNQAHIGAPALLDLKKARLAQSNSSKSISRWPERCPARVSSDQMRKVR